MALINSQVMKRRHTKRGVMLSVTFRCSHSYKDGSGKPLPRVAYYSVADWVVRCETQLPTTVYVLYCDVMPSNAVLVCCGMLNTRPW